METFGTLDQTSVLPVGQRSAFVLPARSFKGFALFNDSYERRNSLSDRSPSTASKIGSEILVYSEKPGLDWLFGRLITQIISHEKFFVIAATILLVLLGYFTFSYYIVFLFIIIIGITYFIFNPYCGIQCTWTPCKVISLRKEYCYFYYRLFITNIFNTDVVNKTVCLGSDNTFFYYGAVIIC